MSMMNVPDVVQDSMRHAQLHSSRRAKTIRPKSRGDIINENKIIRLQNEIKDSKQAVVNHILHARTLQNDLSQVKVIDKALKSHLKSMLKSRQLEDLGKRVLWLAKGTMSKIERLSGSSGYGANIQQSLNGYNDDEMCAVLQSLPGKFNSIIHKLLCKNQSCKNRFIVVAKACVAQAYIMIILLQSFSLTFSSVFLLLSLQAEKYIHKPLSFYSVSPI